MSSQSSSWVQPRERRARGARDLSRFNVDNPIALDYSYEV